MTRERKSSSHKLIFLALFLFLLAGAAAFVVADHFSSSSLLARLFSVPGKVLYSDSLTDAERSLLASLFEGDDVRLTSDLSVSAFDALDVSSLAANERLFSISVPVTNFYSSEANLDVSTPAELQSADLIPLSELNFQKKLLSVNNNYYLDSFTSGALFRVLRFESADFDSDVAPRLTGSAFDRTFPTKDSVLTFAQTGVTALSRGMNAKLAEVGDPKYFSSSLAPLLSSFDLTHTSNESSFSPFASSANICSDPRFLDTLLDIGLDIVELTGNHNVDCGDDSALSTIDSYREKGISLVGGGKSATEAAVPLNIDQKNTSITFLAYNESTGGATLDDTPGANQYSEENAVAEISAAKSRGDFVIVDVQYYECSMYVSDVEDSTCDFANSSAGDQIGFFRHLIDLGADLVVGTSAHQPQTFELYGNGAIYYGLGNLFFDQSWWPGTSRSLILAHYFYDGHLLQTKILPTAYDSALQPHLLDAETSAWFLSRLASARP